jgi:Na+(H+)/acetate symporter ActP
MGLVPCIAVSTAYILLTMFLAEALRKVFKATIPVGLAR